MAKNALKNNIITKDKLSEFEQYWQKYTMNLLVYFAQDEPLMKKYYGEIWKKAKGENSISGICIQIDRELAFSGLFGTGKKTDYGSPVSFNPLLIFQSDTEAIKYAREFLFTLPADFAKKMNIELFDCLQKMKAERFQFLKNQSS